jgi:transposase
MDRLEFDLLFRWFVGIGVDDGAWDHSTFSKNRDRLLEGDIAAKLLGAVLAQPRVKRLLGTDHFSVDGALIEALVRSARTTRTPRRRTRRRSCIAKGWARSPSSASWATP